MIAAVDSKINLATVYSFRDLAYEIGSHLPLGSCARLAQVAKRFSFLTSDEVFLRRKAFQFQLTFADDSKVIDVLRRSMPFIHEMRNHPTLLSDQLNEEKSHELISWMIKENHFKLVESFINGKIPPSIVEDTSKVFPMSSTYLHKALLAAINNYRTRILKTILANESFNRLPTHSIEDVFISAAKEKHPECLEGMISSTSFSLISPDALGKALSAAAEGGYQGCIEKIISCKRFDEISPTSLGQALICAAMRGHQKCLEMIISCSRFHVISPACLASALSRAAGGNHQECLAVIIANSRFEEISPPSVGFAYICASIKGHKKCQEMIPSSGRFN